MTARHLVASLILACVLLLDSGSGLAEPPRLRVNFDADFVTADDVLEALDPLRRTVGSEVSVSVALGFASGSAELPKSSRRYLASIAEAVTSPRMDRVLLIVEGHTDASGDANYNRELSLQRAFRVAEYLATLGVPRSRLALRGAGKDDLLPGVDPLSEVQRRIEFVRRFVDTDRDETTGADKESCKVQTVLAAHGLSVLESLVPSTVNPVFSPQGLRALFEILDWGASARARSQIEGYYFSTSDSKLDTTLRLTDCAWMTGTDPGSTSVESVSMDLILLSEPLVLTEDVARKAEERVPAVETHAIPESGFRQWLESVNLGIEEATAGRVRNALNLEGTEELVVSNVLSLNAPWLLPFDEALTEQAEFTLWGGSKVTVPMMISEERLVLYAEDDRFFRVLLPYADRDHYMHLIVPRDGGDAGAAGLFGLLVSRNAEILGLRMARSDFSDEAIIDWNGKAGRAIVHLPRFEVSGDIDIADHVKAGGYTALFSDPEAFAGLTGQSLQLRKITQSIRMRTDEMGSQTSAVSSAVMGRSAQLEPVLEIRFDRPFLYVVGQASSGALLAMGIIGNPLAAE